MTIQSDMALMAAGSYWDVRIPNVANKSDNRAPTPEGWKVLTQFDEPGSGSNAVSGFSARAYQNIASGEIVISYAGTEFSFSQYMGIDVPSPGLQADFVNGNIPLAIGRYAEQALEAAQFYQRVKADAALSDNISFTGHSLGGGLASMMAVWFDRPAMVFAAAPFQLSADSWQSTIIPESLSALVLPRVRYLLGANIDDALKNYNPSIDFATREARVSAVAIKGELLEANLGMLNWIEKIPSKHLYDSTAVTLDAGNKHSIDLHVAALLVPNFETQAIQVPNALKLMMDASLYGGDVLGNKQLIITKLVRNEVGVRDDTGTTVLLAANGMLTSFANDLNKLGTNIAGLNKAAQDAIIAQGIEWYYWQGTDYAGQQFFVNDQAQPSLLQYTTAQGAGLLGAQNKATTYLNKWLTPIYNTHNEFGGRVTFDQWNVATGSDAVTATARNAGKTQMFIGGTGADTFTGGDGIDVLLGGGEADTLDGGLAGDSLYGGEGNDRYNFNGSFGSDVVLDSDGQGTIWVDRVQVTGGKKLADNVWESDDGNFSFSQMGGNLIIGRGRNADANTMKGSITVQGWSSTNLGITLSDSQVTPPTGALFFNGDQRAKIIGIETQQWVPSNAPNFGTYAWGETAWANDGKLTNGIAAPDFSDVINAAVAGSNGSVIHGYGGNDALSGSSGYDDIFGDDGDDLIGGGAGSDNIRGGDGNDFINSSATLSVSQRWKPTDSWSAPVGKEVLAQGAGWGIYVERVYLDGSKGYVWSGANSPSGDDADVVDAGAGNDFVITGGGNDRVQGGTGDDELNGMGGNDILEGDDGNDLINGDGVATLGLVNFLAGAQHGSDYIDGGAGNDTLRGNGGNDEVYGGAGNDTMFGDEGFTTCEALVNLDPVFHGNDYMDGEDGDDYMEGGGKDDTMYGGAGNDVMLGDISAAALDMTTDAAYWGNDYLDGEDGNDELVGGGRDDTLYGGSGDDLIWGDFGVAGLDAQYFGRDYLDGEDGNDYLIGGGNDDILYGGAGNDVLKGDDDLSVVAAEYQGDDYLDGEDGNDILLGGGGDDILIGGAGNDYLDGGTGADYMEGGAGDDVYVVDNKNDVIFEIDAPDAQGNAPTPSIDYVLTSVDYELGHNLDNLTLTGTAAINGTGNALRNLMQGNSAANVLDAGAGDDQLDGGAGADTLIGGSGNDFYVVDDIGDAVVEAAEEGDDYVETSVTFTLADNVERMGATGTSNIALTGNALGNALFGNSGNNTLTGAGGTDYLRGGAGNDVYVFNRGDGNGTIDNTDFLRDTANPLLQGATDTLRFGNGVTDKDVIAFRSGDNMYFALKGSTETVFLAGYYAPDVVNGTQVFDHKIDRVEFLNGVVWDQAMIQAMVDRSINNHAPTIAGNVPALQARVGDAFGYTVPQGTIVDADAWDSVAYSVKMQDGSAVPAWLQFDAETRTFTGTPDVASTGTLQFYLWGTDDYGAAIGTLVTLNIAPINRAPVLSTQLVDQSTTQGIAFNYVVPSNAFTDPDAGDVLAYSATLADGSPLPSWLSFNAATRTFSGLPAGLGTTSVRVVARDGGGLSIADVFDIVVRAPNNVGSPGDDFLVGVEGPNSLYGGAGNDTLIGEPSRDALFGEDGNDILVDGYSAFGGAGLDTYKLTFKPDYYNTYQCNIYAGADAGDTIIVGGGLRPSDMQVYRDRATSTLYLTNSVVAGRVYLFGQVPLTGTFSPIAEVRFEAEPGTVWTAADLQQMATTGDVSDNRIWGYKTSSNNMLGGAGADSLYGGDLADTIDGGVGADYLEGGLGNDTYLFGLDSGSDRIVDVSANGGNIVQLKAGVLPANVRLYRIGQTGGDTMSANDSLVLVIASTGARLWIDEFFQPNGKGTVSEIRFADGANTVWNYADIATKAGSSKSGLQNTQTGTAADNVYSVDNGADVIVEAADGGNDTVNSTVSYVLPNEVENLNLVGLLAINGTGNAGDNILRGNDGDNVLRGSNDWDRYSWSTGGNDQYFGGKGDDTYVDFVGDNVNINQGFNTRMLAVTELPNEGYDTIVTNAYSMTMPDNVERMVVNRLSTNVWWHGVYQYVGNAQDNIIDLSGSETDYNTSVRIDGGQGNDIMIGGPTNYITYVVDSVGDVVVASQYAKQTVESSVSYTLGNYLTNLTLTGNAAITGTGNERNNILDGRANTAANVLIGLAGDDTYYLGAGDSIIEAAGGGNDTVVIEMSTGITQGTVDISDWANVESLTLADDVGDINVLGDAGNNVLTGNSWANTIYGLDGDDTLSSNGGPLGGAGANQIFSTDYLYGGRGNDTINCIGGYNFIDGGDGNDTISLIYVRYATVDGGAGDDVILTPVGRFSVQLGAGGGHDLVSMPGYYAYDTRTADDWASKRDTRSSIALATGTDASTVRFTQSGDSLVVSLANSGDTVTINKFFESETTTAIQSTIDSLRLPDGTVLSRDAIAAGLGRTELQTATSGDDLLITTAANHSLDGGAGDDHLVGQGTDDQLDGGTGNDRLYGGEGADQLTGGTGNDTLAGGHGADTYVFGAGWGQDVIDEMQNIDRATSSGYVPWAEDDGVADTIVFDSSIGVSDIAVGMNGLDLILSHKTTGDSITVVNYFYPTEALMGQVELIRFADNTVWDRNAVEQIVKTITGTAGDDELYGLDFIGSDLFGLAGNDILNGQSLDDRLYGGDGNDILSGSDGNDLLDGGAGADEMNGGYGQDTYVVDNAGDVVVEWVEDEIDTVLASLTYTLGEFVENLTLTGTAAINGTGNTAANVLIGNVANNILNGGAGADTMMGGMGNDTYVVDNVADVVVESLGEGIDLVQSSVTYTLAANVENLTLTGSSAIKGTGNALDNVLMGNSGANVLTGGAGNDTYIVGSGDTTIEAANGGTDTVQSAITWTLAANVENLVLTGSSAINGTGNASDNVITGNSAANVLTGGAGNDTYIVGTGDTTIEAANGGTDTVQSAITWTLASEVENLILTGTAAINGTGNASNNIITGNSAANTLSGAAGDDKYLYNIGGGADRVIETTGNDRIVFGAGITAAQLTATRSGSVVKLAVSASDSISFDDLGGGVFAIEEFEFADGSVLGASWLNSRFPNAAPTATNLSAAETYTEDTARNLVDIVVTDTDSANTTVVLTLSNVAAGSLSVATSGTVTSTYNATTGVWTASGAVANVNTLLAGLTFTPSANFNGNFSVSTSVSDGIATPVTGSKIFTGVAVNDAATGTVVITGTAAQNQTLTASNTLADVDGLGAISYQWKAGGVAISGATGSTLVLGAAQVGKAISVTASFTDGRGTLESATSVATAAVIGSYVGTAGADTLSGSTGADWLSGLAGNDTYVVNNAGDLVFENLNEGIDLVQASVTYTLAANVENLTLTGTAAINGTGNALNNVLTGNSAKNILTGGAGDDILDGKGGADTMVGGAGNDVYYVDIATDVVTENANEGTDTVNSSVTLTLSANVENLTLTGTTAINGTGNALDNVLIGNSAVNTLTGGAGNDTLNGGVGADKMLGGLGNDTYVVDNTGDLITENANEGTDSVQSNVTYTLVTNVENLTLTGSSAVNGTGNTADNVLTGNSAANTLTGNAGNDTLDGQGGNDILVGGTGSDTYWLGRGYGVDSVTENDATAGNTDVARFEATVSNDQLWFTKTGNNLEVSIIGTSDKLVMSNWYLGSQYHVEQFKTSNGKTLLDSQVQNLVSAMSAFSPPAAGQTTLPSNYATSLNPVIVANWQ